MSEMKFKSESESKVSINFEGLYQMASELASDQSDKIKLLKSQLATLREALEKISQDKWAMSTDMKGYDCSIASIAKDALKKCFGEGEWDE